MYVVKAINDGLAMPNISRHMHSVKKVIEHFHRSEKFRQCVRDMQETYKLPKNELIQVFI